MTQTYILFISFWNYNIYNKRNKLSEMNLFLLNEMWIVYVKKNQLLWSFITKAGNRFKIIKEHHYQIFALQNVDDFSKFVFCVSIQVLKFRMKNKREAFSVKKEMAINK